MKAAVCTPEGTVQLNEYNIPKIGDGEVLVKLLACGVCGTDVRKVSPGKLAAPAVLGHEVVGEVVESNAPGRFKPGDRLATSHHVPCFECHFCKHENYSMCEIFKKSGLDPGGFSEYLRIPQTHVETVAQRIPNSVSSEEAVFMEPVACCLRAIKRCRVLSGDTVLVTGLGSVGLLFGLLLKQEGATALGLDPLGERANLALEFGFQKTFTTWNAESCRNVKKMSQQRGVDAVIISAGTPALLKNLIEGLRNGGTLCLFGGSDDTAMAELPWNEVYRRELTLNSSYSPSPADIREAFQLICGGLLKNKCLPMTKYPLDKISKAIQDVKTKATLKALVTP